MSIKEFWEKYGDQIVVFLTVLLAIGASFFAGRMSILENGKLPVDIRLGAGSLIVEKLQESAESDNVSDNLVYANTESGIENTTEMPRYGMFIASKNSDIYHLWTCSSVDRIKDDNKIWFDTKEEAEETGREMANDCR
ncbi:hypothetical protein D4R87_01075 [bacterium]|nr:MAG: hypothetical protein D4R87_01075 [bacterium]